MNTQYFDETDSVTNRYIEAEQEVKEILEPFIIKERNSNICRAEILCLIQSVTNKICLKYNIKKSLEKNNE